jgi:hypothetical protein
VRKKCGHSDLIEGSNTFKHPSIFLGSNRETNNFFMLQIGGIWHTSVVVGGVEFFYGGGVQRALAGTTPYGRPVEVIELG